MQFGFGSHIIKIQKKKVFYGHLLIEEKTHDII